MTFSEPLTLNFIGDYRFQLVVPFSCILDDERVIVVPEGAVTDFASTPRCIWSVIPPHGKYAKAAVIHDFLYQTTGFGGIYSRKDADLIFLDGMKVLGVGWLQRHTMYRAVRIYSAQFWDRDRRRSLNPATTPKLLGTSRTEKTIATLDPKVQNAFKKFASDANLVARDFGCEYIAISGNRTWAEQDALYAQGRTKPGRIVTNARGGYSNHNFGVAADFGVFKGSRYMDEKNPSLASKVHKKVAQDARDYGLDWGGNWTSIKDYPHFEYHTGLSMEEKRNRYKKFGTVFVNQ